VNGSRRAFCIAATGLALPAVGFAQAGDGLAIRASRRDPITAAATVTAVFTVTSQRSDTVSVMPHVEAPKDWTLLLGGSAFDAAGGQTSMLVLSVAVPSRMPAGTYPMRVWLTTSNDVKGTMDSVVVVVPPRRALDLVLTDRPGYAVAGTKYEVGFIVRNRGNTTSRLAVEARSSLGVATTADTLFDLGPEETRPLRVRVRTPAGLSSASDDVLEVTGRVMDDSLRADASARLTVVPAPTRTIEEFLRLPTQINLRAASASGVSPFEIYGRGPVIDGSDLTVDFLLRGSPGAFSPYGERDEYRINVESGNWRVRGGDHVFMLSSLTGSGQPGFGIGAGAHRGMWTAGAHSQQFRLQPGGGAESGAYVSVAPLENGNLTLNALSRDGGSMPGSVGSAAASAALAGFTVDGELARSSRRGSAGWARTVRTSGNRAWFSMDGGHLEADTAFTGPQRGSRHDYVSARSSYWSDFVVGATASGHRTDLSRSTGVPYVERFTTGGLSLSAYNRVTLELGSALRSTATAGATQTGRQQTARARADQSFAFGTLTLEAELGQATDAGAQRSTFTDFSLAARLPLRGGSVGGYVGRYSGGALTKGATGSVTLGGDFTQRIGSATDVSVMGYALRQDIAGNGWHSQFDAQVARWLANGSALRLRARLIGGGTVAATEENVAYLEYSMPTRLPVSRLRTSGRVYGRVVDAVSGSGVANALVRLGPQVAITDKTGKVAFGGVPGGEHRLSMSQETSFADAVFVGDPTLAVDSTRTQPTTFTLAIARSARVDVSVRRLAVVRTGVGGQPDSLAASGMVANATLVLVGERDTLYRTTSDDGEASFTDIPPGRWRLTIRGDAPAFHRFEPDRLELSLEPGEARTLEFRLVPRRREVQVIGGEQELRPQAADPKTQAGQGVRVIKPNDMRPNDRQH